MKKYSIILLIILSIFLVMILSSCDDNKQDTLLSEIDKASKKYKNIDEVFNEVRTKLKNIDYKEDVVEQAVFEGEIKIDTLPEIDEFEIVSGSNYENSNKLQIEIFASTEKSSPQTSTDRWLVDVANDFNKAGIKASNGKVIEIQIRRIASGTGYEFIKAGKYIPDAYTPSNELWVKMVEVTGVETELITESLVTNYAGLVINKNTEKLLREEYQEISFETIVDAVIKKKISAAYTNPKASSTGLNMLYTILYELAEGNSEEIFSDKIIHSFEVFQEKVPLIATTTLHLRDLFEQGGGKLDAFPTEYQTYQKMVDRDKLEFIPFGVKHSNPLYAMGNGLKQIKKEALIKFSEFAKSKKYQNLAKNFGFKKLEYKGIKEPDGATLIKSQKLWKEHKDSGKTVYAYFLADTSGSMGDVDNFNRSKLSQLKLALEQASKHINQGNHIGIMEFNTTVINRLDPIPFDLIQRGKFLTAVRNLYAGGGTAMYDGILACISKLLEIKKKDPNGKFYLFVLTDGISNEGYDYKDMFEPMVGSDIRIYPIAYGDAGIDELNKLAKIGETGLIQGTTDNIIQKLMALFDLSL